jgi:hypothetical protein
LGKVKTKVLVCQVKEEMEKAEAEGNAPEKSGLNEDGIYDSADYRYTGTVHCR